MAILSQYFVVTTKGELYRITDRDNHVVTSLMVDGKPDILQIGRILRSHLVRNGVAPSASLVNKLVDYFKFNAEPDWIMSKDGDYGPHEWRIDWFPQLNKPDGTPPSPLALPDTRQEALFA